MLIKSWEWQDNFLQVWLRADLCWVSEAAHDVIEDNIVQENLAH